MTLEFIEDMIERFKTGKKIHKKYAYQIVLKAKEIFYAEPTMPEVTIIEGKKMTVCGDTHGIFSGGLYGYCQIVNFKQANTSISSKSSIVTATHQKLMLTFSTEISLIVDLGPPRLRSFFSRTSGYTQATFSLTVAITRRTI